MLRVKSIDPQRASEMITSGEAVLIDVREPGEYQEIHIEGAHLIPMGTLSYEKLPAAAKDKKIIVHCKLGKRGGMCCEKLMNENPNLDVYNLEGGIIAWEDAGLHCIK